VKSTAGRLVLLFENGRPARRKSPAPDCLDKKVSAVRDALLSGDVRTNMLSQCLARQGRDPQRTAIVVSAKRQWMQKFSPPHLSTATLA